ncbi:hypothetical protein GCM10009665_47370 [Kitasatospora nipponensis]|uniref:Secreted protein n=1 Tax=Kitasatospora nipponensis TaxID=258049 RepID=A0ABP4H5Z4_9ACTN
MLARRTSVRAAVAALGVGAVLALSSPAAFADQPPVTLTAGPCQAIQKIETHYYAPGTAEQSGWHDAQAIDPIANNASDPYYCQFKLTDNYGATPLYSSMSGSESPWWYDGPGHHIQACVYYMYAGQVKAHQCGVTN